MGFEWGLGGMTAPVLCGRAINSGVAAGAVEAGAKIRQMFSAVPDEGEQN
jgi:hypothetical protein